MELELEYVDSDFSNKRKRFNTNEELGIFIENNAATILIIDVVRYED